MSRRRKSGIIPPKGRYSCGGRLIHVLGVLRFSEGDSWVEVDGVMGRQCDSDDAHFLPTRGGFLKARCEATRRLAELRLLKELRKRSA